MTDARESSSNDEIDIDFDEVSIVEQDQETERSQASESVNIYSSLAYRSIADIDGDQVTLKLQADLLPLSLQSAYGFPIECDLVHITFVLENAQWNRKPLKLDSQHRFLD
jgi:hypothetical protein